MNSIIPKLVAFKSVMVLRNISVRKEQEGRLAKEKEERDRRSQRAGRQAVDVEALSQMEREIYARLQLEANSEVEGLNEQ